MQRDESFYLHRVAFPPARARAWRRSRRRWRRRQRKLMVSSPGLSTLDGFHLLSALERLLASDLLNPASVGGSNCRLVFTLGDGLRRRALLEGVSLFLSHHARFHPCSADAIKVSTRSRIWKMRGSSDDGSLVQICGSVLMPLVVDSRDPCGSSSSLLGLEFAHQLAIAARCERIKARRGGRYGVPCRERSEEQGDAHEGEKDGAVPTKEALSVPPGRGITAASGHPPTSARSRRLVGAEMRIERIGPPVVVTARGVPCPVIVRPAVPPRPTAHRASSSEVVLGGRLGPR